MNVILVEPSFPHNQREFVRALNDIGARVIGIGERPASHLDSSVRTWLSHYEQVRSVVHEPSLLHAVRKIQSMLRVDRIEATVEAHIMPTAKVREASGIPGTSVRTAYLCRDKPAMKQVLREAGVPCAMSTRATAAEDVMAFIKKAGLPIILKPTAGAGASGTHKVSRREDLEAIMQECGLDRGHEVAVEEFIEGHEGFLDTVTVDGEVIHEFITHYYPNVLVAMRERWISPQMICTNRMNAEGYDEVKKMARKVIGALDIGTSATHMEWFYGPRGLKFSEIGCRPPGVGQWDVYNTANDFDLYLEWASAIVRGNCVRQPSRRYSCGMIALRPDGDGHITGYEGIDAIQRQFGEHIVAAHLPDVGTATQPVEAGYMANAWLRVRHPDFDQLRQMLDTIGQTVKVHAR